MYSYTKDYSSLVELMQSENFCIDANNYLTSERFAFIGIKRFICEVGYMIPCGPELFNLNNKEKRGLRMVLLY